MLRLACLALCVAVVSAEGEGLYDGEDAVTSLTTETFKSLVMESSKPWLVEFYAPWCGHCQKLAPDWVEASKIAAKTFKGKFFLGVVDADVEKELAGEYGVRGFPTIKYFPSEKEDRAEDFGGRDKDAIVEFMEGKVGKNAPSSESKLAPAVDYLKLWSFIYSDTAPSVVLLSDGKRRQAPGWFSTVATFYKKGKKKSVKFAYVSARDEGRTGKRLKVEIPELIVVLPAKKGKGKGKGKTRFVRFTTEGDGDISETSTIKLRKEVRAFVDDVVEGKHKGEVMPSLPEPSRPRKVNPIELHELTPDNTDSICYQQRQKKMCVVVLVAEDSDGSFAEKEVLAKVSKKYRNDPFVFAYVKAKEQQTFVEGFGLDVANLPLVVTIKTGKRKRFATTKLEAFTAKKMSTFLDKVVGGNVRFQVVKAELPELEASWEKLVDEKD